MSFYHLFGQTEIVRDTIIIEFENNIKLNSSYTEKKCDTNTCTYYFYIYSSPKFEEGVTYTFTTKKKCGKRKDTKYNKKMVFDLNYFYYNSPYDHYSKYFNKKEFIYFIREKNKNNLIHVFDQNLIMEIE